MLLVFAVAFGFFYGAFSNVSAHTLETDGTMGVIMHTDPEDNPQVNQKALIYFDLKDSLNKFDHAKCDCKALILKEQNTLFENALSFLDQSGEYSATTNFTFPEKGNYTIRLEGVSKDGSFQNFNLNYDLSVGAKGSGSAAPHEHNKQTHTAHFVLFGLGFLGVFYVIWDEKTKKSRAHKG